ncbi:flippase activity-associated protein Agl23 [Natronomonas sp. EA1]|uniref:flippase activity-associated protein Agl23 n=1 Tax=Natronomonas sp. EA1 TaxID=3421655 RepID=UPI003EBD1D2A
MARSPLAVARARLRGDRTLQAVLALVALALLARFVLLGARVAHFDEGRVAYWTLEYLRTGEFHYRYIIHGPFIQHLNVRVFSLLGATDFATRVVVALVGGLLPASALLFRERLRDLEVAILAGFLAFNPVILYYSRFSRSTLLVAAFAFVAFGFFLRTYDGHGPRSFHLGVLFLAVAFASKENAIVYVLCWLGASGLLLDHFLFRPGAGEGGLARAKRALAGYDTDDARAVVIHGLLGLALFALVSLYFYAPRNPNGLGLWSALFSPGALPELVAATADDIAVGYGYWLGGPASSEDLAGEFITRLGQFMEATVLYAAPLFSMAVVGFLAERWVADEPRSLVMFASYWGFVSVLGYPLGTDIWGAWIIVNALVPLTIPAAVGLTLVVDAGIDAYESEDAVSVGAVGVICLVLAAQGGFAAYSGVYAAPTSADNELVQYAQPSQELRAILDDTRGVADATQGPDVLVYGEKYVDGDETAERTPACLKWFESLPLAWYFEADGMDVTCATETTGLPDELPPIVFAEAEVRNGEYVAPAELRERAEAEGYEKRTFMLRTTAKPMVVYLDAESTE